MLNVPKLAVLPLLLVQLTLFVGTSFSFQTSTRRSFTTTAITSLAAIRSDESDFPPEEDGFESEIDWDSEWKKVVQNEGKLKTGQRPGSDFYKSEAEISAIKAANKAAMKAAEVSNSLPQMSSFTGDWKFWIAILAIVSIGLSVLNAPPAMPPGGGADGGSYYI
eukprot:scaffold13192_cov51-Cylindrotheca_fusiformis.AAC.2